MRAAPSPRIFHVPSTRVAALVLASAVYFRRVHGNREAWWAGGNFTPRIPTDGAPLAHHLPGNS